MNLGSLFVLSMKFFRIQKLETRIWKIKVTNYMVYIIIFIIRLFTFYKVVDFLEINPEIIGPNCNYVIYRR